METLGKRISENRKAKNIKQDELAEMLLVSPQAVSKWENDLSCPDISVLPELSKILGITVDELLSGYSMVPVHFPLNAPDSVHHKTTHSQYVYNQ